MSLLRAADRVAVPWKNAGGVTREVAACPPGAGMADFGWRVSVADVAAAGPFSRFDGVDRILTVLSGRLRLAFADGRVVDLPPGEPFAFPGDAAVTGIPLDGPVRDLNVMVRRGAWHAEVTHWRPGLLAQGTRIAVALPSLDALLLAEGEAPPDDFTGLLITLDPTPPIRA